MPLRTACRKLGLTRKKTLIAKEQDHPSVAEQQEQWQATQSSTNRIRTLWLNVRHWSKSPSKAN